MIKAKKTALKSSLIIGSFFLFLGAIALCYIYIFHGNLFGWTAPQSNRGVNSVNYGSPTSDQTKNGTSIKEQATAGNGSTNTDKPSSSNLPGSNQKAVDVSITAANQNGSLLQIRTLIGADVNSGTCTLTLSQSGQATITRTANVQALASTSTCQGFDVETSDLPTKGVWHAVAVYNSTSLTGSASKDITIR